MYDYSSMKFSIVIPAHNEEASIAAAIGALKTQTVPRETYEILVVDNDSTDRTADAARQAGADRVVFEKEHGTNIARQRGFVASRGEIVAFLDADCIPPINWLEHIARDFKKTGAALVSGPYDYGFKNRLTRAFTNFYTNILSAHADKIFPFLFGKKAGVIVEGNFAAYRTAIDAIGGLPPLKFWGDGAAIAMLVSRRVGRVYFDPTLIVKSSPRRFKDEGTISVVARYVWAYLRVYFKNEEEWARLNRESKEAV